MEYIVIGLLMLGAIIFLFRYFRKTVKEGCCPDCAKHCGHQDKDKCGK